MTTRGYSICPRCTEIFADRGRCPGCEPGSVVEGAGQADAFVVATDAPTRRRIPRLGQLLQSGTAGEPRILDWARRHRASLGVLALIVVSLMVGLGLTRLGEGLS